jgi:hypothetical protein
MLLIPVLSLFAAGAYAETLFIYGINLQKPPSKDELSFSVTVKEAGAYQARLLVYPKSQRDYVLTLTLNPAREGEPVTIRFSFTGRGCG